MWKVNVQQYEIMYSLLNSKFNTCPSEQGLPSSLQSDSRDSSNCSFWYTTNGLYSNRDTWYSGGKCVNFEMSEVVTVKLSPNHSNIMYVERRRIDLETDF